MDNHCKTSSHRCFFTVLIVLLLLSLACSTVTSLISKDQESAESYSEEEQPQYSMAPPAEGQPPAESMPGKPLHQWASRAVASSEYGAEDWSAKQATGKPNTPTCGDEVTAWASASSNEVETLEVYFDTAVHAFQVDIIQSYHPDQVVQVELIKQGGGFVTVYTHAPRAVDICPFKLTVDFEPTAFLVSGVRITVDQSVLGLGWNEIDAVQLVGFPE